MAGEMNSLLANIPGFADAAMHLGMSSFLGIDPDPQAAAAAAPQITPPKNSARMATMRDERLQENLSRPRTVARPAQTRNSQSGTAPNIPGVMSSDVLMDPAVQHLLGQYGQSPEMIQQAAQNASPDLFLTNKGFHANHPRLAGALEGAMEGLAFTRGGSTIGENIGNVMQGMLTAKQARVEKYNNQLMMPFMQAQQVANLQGTNLHQQYEDAETKRANAQAEAYAFKPQYEQGMLDLHRQLGDQTNRTKQLGIQMRGMAVPALHPAYLSPESEQKLEALEEQYGGVAGIPDSSLQPLLAEGQRNLLDAQTKAKIGVKGAPSGASRGTTNGRGRGGVASGKTPEAAEYSAAGKDLGNFDKRYPFVRDPSVFDDPSHTVLDPDNKNTQGVPNTIMRGSTRHNALVARRLGLDQRAQKARAAYEASQQGMSVPGSGMTGAQTPPAAGNTYDPATKTWH